MTDRKRINPLVVLEYAFDATDIKRSELGKFKPLPLDKALKVAKNLLESGYVMMKLTIEGY